MARLTDEPPSAASELPPLPPEVTDGFRAVHGDRSRQLPVAVAVLLVFIAGVGINLRRGRRVRCGCFGGSGELLSGRTLVRLAILLAGAALLMVLDSVSGTQAFTVGEVIAGGWSGLVYGAHIAGLTAFLLLSGLWLLHLPELASLQGGR